MKARAKILIVTAIVLLLSRKTIAMGKNEDQSLLNFSYRGTSFPPGLARGMKINNPGNLREFGDN